MHDIERTIQDFLSASVEGTAPFDEKLLNECIESVKLSILNSFHGEDKSSEPFRLRMSNIGRPLRQLMLEKRFGRKKATADFIMKMQTGSLQEHILLYIVRSAGLEIDTNLKVELNIGGEKILGETDWVFKKDNTIWDVKTASDYSFKMKFGSYQDLASDDAFGYIDQLIGYAKAAGMQPGGWVVENKSTGQIKLLEFPYTLEAVEGAFEQRVLEKMKALAGPCELENMPPCPGVGEETFYQKPTGNKVLKGNCMFCDHKEKCHPTLSYEPSRVSKAKDKPMVYYVN